MDLETFIWIDDDIPVEERGGVYGHEQYHVRNLIYISRFWLGDFYNKRKGRYGGCVSSEKCNLLAGELRNDILERYLALLEKDVVHGVNPYDEDDNPRPKPSPLPGGDVHPDGLPRHGIPYDPRGPFDPNSPTEN